MALRLQESVVHDATVVYDRPVVDERLDRDRRFVLRALACLLPTMACAAGSSVFPTGGAANPTLTIVALALRLSDRLRETLE